MLAIQQSQVLAYCDVRFDDSHEEIAVSTVGN